MSQEAIEVNAIGDACPIPVVKTMKAVAAAAEGATVVTSVDNLTSVKNLQKFASEKGLASSVEDKGDGSWQVSIQVGAGAAEAAKETDPADYACCVPGNGVVVAITADHMGEGSDELGRTLMKGFIYALTQQEVLPKCVLFYNGGVRLTTEGSDSIEDIKALVDAGVEVLSCGTCLNFYGLAEKLQVGEVTNMYVIAQRQMEASHVVRP
ncbi:sulfurtransferase-like selenium metabolism protein YedF [uncultured Olsenella sp.]|uniref:sulfurtransferase-like selenium metabolism protein YedF n=1 Tax=uncultured Olsenella sp. TaxID=190764 RepID=UPI0026DB431B|nr:sulfurtransferase-like selenium metabolism protein YedF [uncultured Olsenella sp.]